ncbi:MAG: hypothetical protein ACSLFD_02375 [Solirubrobacterales bacterium]
MGGTFIVFIALCFGIPTAIIGRAKGGSFLLWLVIGTCLPGFGLAAVILMRNEINEPERQCPNCNNIVKLYVQVCPRCGMDLYLPPVEETRMPPQ